MVGKNWAFPYNRRERVSLSILTRLWKYLDWTKIQIEVYWKENEGTDNGLKHPATLYFPFVEKFGTFLVRFLNADLSTYESAYKDNAAKISESFRACGGATEAASFLEEIAKKPNNVL